MMEYFLGIVDNIDDPLKLGRIKVRSINEDNETIETDDLPWATIINSSTSASYLGIGNAPVGIQVGSRVIGFHLDGDKKTKPIILGTLPFIRNGDDSDHSVSSIARGNGPVQKQYLEYEPQTEYKAEYPYNSVITTKSGHVIEIDDTPKSERIHIYHQAGSYVEFFPDGRVVHKSSADSIDISMEDKQIISDNGNIYLTSDKDLMLESENGSAKLAAKGDVGILSTSGGALLHGTTIEIDSDGSISIKGSNIKIDGDTTLSGDLTITGKVSITGSLTVNGKPVG